MIQRIHDDCSGLGAACKAMPEKDRVYSSQVLKEGEIIKHLAGKHRQKTHGGGKGAKGRETKKKTASGITSKLPKNLGLMDRKKKIAIIKELSELPTGELEKAFSANNKKLDNPNNDLELRNALIFGKMLEDATKKKKAKLKRKAALTLRAQADAPNYAPASTPQRCKNCKFFLGDPGRDWCERFDFTADRQPDEIPGYVANKTDFVEKDYNSSTVAQRRARDAVKWAIKNGELAKASTKKCFKCGNPAEEYHHVNGYRNGDRLKVRPVCSKCHSAIDMKKADLAALTEGILILRGGRTSGNWGHVGRKGKRGGSGRGGGFGRIGVKPGSSRKQVKRAAKKKMAPKKPEAKKKVATKKPEAKKKVVPKKPEAEQEESTQGLSQNAKKLGWRSKGMGDFEKKHAGASGESAAVYDANGKEIFQTKGKDKLSVDFNDDQLRQMKGAIVTHNHPPTMDGKKKKDGASFSESDIRLMLNTGAAEVRAVTENYVYVVRPKMVAGRVNRNALNFLNDRKKEVNKKVSKKFHQSKGKMTKIDFQIEFWHELWKSAADDGLIEYERIKR
jgi:hypothetical protein